MPWDPDDGSIRRPMPVKPVSAGKVITQHAASIRQQERQMTGQPLRQSTVGALYTGSDSHGPGGDDDHPFSFSVGSSGEVWVAQVCATTTTDGTTGTFGVSVGGSAPEGTQTSPLASGTGSAIATCLVISGTALTVLCQAVAAGATSYEFAVEVTAYRIS